MWMVNSDTRLGLLLEDVIVRLPPGSSFSASRRLCSLLTPSVGAVFGPFHPVAASHVQSVCHQLHVPHLDTRATYSHLDTRATYSQHRTNFTFNLRPHPAVLGRAIVDLVKAMEWKDVVVMYQEQEGLVNLQELLKYPDIVNKVKITVMKLDPDGDFRTTLKLVKSFEVRNIVVDCRFEDIEEVMEQAANVGMVTDYHNYLFTSLDLDKVSLGRWSHSSVNLTGFRLVDPGSMAARHYRNKFPFNAGGRNHQLYTDNALLYDAVKVLALALSYVRSYSPINDGSLNCKNNQSWEVGRQVAEFLKTTDAHGLTGNIKFDREGMRTTFTLDLMEKERRRMQRTGSWHPNTGVNFTFNQVHNHHKIIKKLQNKVFKIATVRQEPYVMEKIEMEDVDIETRKRMSFLERYEGFCIDLIQELSQLLNFKYEFYLTEGYGKEWPPGSGNWNGLIGEVRGHRADMAIIDLSITASRQMAADFTMPFMTTGVSILYYKKAAVSASLWSFLYPLSNEVWLYMATAYVATSILLFFLARVSPYEWTPSQTVTEDCGKKQLENTTSLHNCFWLNWGGLMCQGSDIAPKSISCRMVAVSWWAFTLILMSSYTANLAACLTSNAMEGSIRNVEDLTGQYKVSYGCVGGGSTRKMFQGSSIPTYKAINLAMEGRTPSVYTRNNKEGLERVQKGKGDYAFFMEAAAIEYHVQRKCWAKQLGGLLDSKGYGIALPQGSPYSKAMSDGIVQLQEAGTIAKLKKKWWEEERITTPCQVGDKVSSLENARMSLRQLGGVFIFLVGGLLIAVIIAIFEFIWSHRKLAVDSNESVFLFMWQEIKFSVNPAASDYTYGETPPRKKEVLGSADGSLHKYAKDASLHKYAVIGVGGQAKRTSDATTDSSYACFNDYSGDPIKEPRQ